MKPTRLLQSRAFETFRCIGSDCEDTCCDGWGVSIDRLTYIKYQECSDPVLRSQLNELVTINADDRSDDHYARIALDGTRCPFLAEGLCSIQQRLGEDYLSKVCATYPRASNLIDQTLQRTLDLSCPEAARRVLLDSAPVEFLETPFDGDLSRIANFSVLNTASTEHRDKPYAWFWEVRRLVVSLLQNRSYELWERMVILALLCDQLGETPQQETAQLVEAYRDAIGRRSFADALAACHPQPAAQLEIVLELIVARITSDFTNRRFLQCYEQFMQGLEWTNESGMQDLGRRYDQAYIRYFAPIMCEHGYMLEQYLVNYAYKTLFPFGPQQSNHKLNTERSIFTHYMLMTAYYAIIKTVLIGMAGFHKEAFDSGHVVKLIQSFTRAFEHSVSYPEKIAEILSSKGIKCAANLAVLVRN